MGTQALNIRPLNKELVVPVAFVKTNFLFGVNLKDDDGNEMPDSLHEFYIRSATEWLQTELEVYLNPVEVTDEAHDYYYNDYSAYNFVKMFCKPVREVTALRIQFPNTESFINFDPSWFRAEYMSGQMILLPQNGTISGILMGNSGAYLPALHAVDSIPFIVRADYKAGFAKAEDIPSDILEIIGMKASLGPLNIAGDLIAGAGIATQSLSLDGLSQSIGTTSSATNAGYGARIIQYNKEINDRMATLKQKYRGIAMAVS